MFVCSLSDRPVVSDAPPGFRDRSSKEAAQLGAPETATPAQENGNAELSSGAPQDAEKQLRNLRKKIRQAEATASKAKEGKQLSPEEQEKLQRLETW